MIELVLVANMKLTHLETDNFHPMVNTNQLPKNQWRVKIRNKILDYQINIWTTQQYKWTGSKTNSNPQAKDRDPVVNLDQNAF